MLMSKISALIRGPRELPCAFCHEGGMDTVKIVVYEPGSRLSSDIESACALFLLLDHEKQISACISHPVYGIFVRAI